MSISYGQSIGGDPLHNLPVDQTPPTTNEIQIVDKLFKNHQNALEKIMKEASDSFIVMILFVFISLPQISEIIERLVPSTKNSVYISVALKALIAGVLFWLIKHFYLSRK